MNLVHLQSIRAAATNLPSGISRDRLLEYVEALIASTTNTIAVERERWIEEIRMLHNQLSYLLGDLERHPERSPDEYRGTCTSLRAAAQLIYDRAVRAEVLR